MSRRTSEANKAIAAAWQHEQELVRDGKGTRDWTQEQQQDILDKGKAYDDNGKAFEGHHMKNAERYPEYQGDAENIQFLTRQEHFAAHGGNFQNPTNGYYNPFTGETTPFGEGKYEPCEIINLTDPVVSIQHKIADANESEAVVAEENTETPSRTQVQREDKIPSQPQPKAKRDALPKIEISTPKIKKGIKTAMSGAGKFAKGLWENHKEEIIGGAVTLVLTVGAAIVDAVISSDNDSENDSNSSDSNHYYPYSDDDSEYDTVADDCVEDSSEYEVAERSSPREHMVKPHGQRYGKDKVWKEKEAYPRGGKKDE